MPASTAQTPALPAKPDYGIDAPGVVKQMFSRGIMIFLLGFGLWYMNTETNPKGGRNLFLALGPLGAGFIATGIMMLWASRSAKLKMRDQLLDTIAWRGDEKVLDVGCGRGLMMIGAAKRLKSGRVTGADIWSTEDLSGNKAEATLANARAEGVADKVKIENADARRLPYQANSFDVVTATLVIHNISDPADRVKALDEIVRVTKPGGHILIWDIFKTAEYIEHYEKAGLQFVQRPGTTFQIGLPSRWFLARKPA